MMRTATLLMTLFLASCAKENLPTQDSATEAIPPAFIESVDKPLAKGIQRKDLLLWGLALSEKIDKVNCTFFELRKLNTVGEFEEKKPSYCNDESDSNPSDKTKDNDE